MYYATQTLEWAATFAPVMNRFNVFMEAGTPPQTPKDQLAIAFDLPPALLELKLLAIQEHVSQVEGMLNAFGKDFFRDAMKSEFFRLAAER